tara:strand:- start:960 stop:1175 length:216 start_codon:yes stop_codon:yes gene_type:complete
MSVKDVFFCTDWNAFERQKKTLIRCCDGNPDLLGLLEFIDVLQDAIVSEEILSESTIFPSLAADKEIYGCK